MDNLLLILATLAPIILVGLGVHVYNIIRWRLLYKEWRLKWPK